MDNGTAEQSQGWVSSITVTTFCCLYCSQLDAIFGQVPDHDSGAFVFFDTDTSETKRGVDLLCGGTAAADSISML